jgi:hypothetical protein
MTQIVECYFWSSILELEDTLEFEYQNIGEGIELKKPIFDIKSLEKIISGLKDARTKLLSRDVVSTLESIDRVTDLWLNPNYEKRKKAMKLLPMTTGFSSEMIEALIKHYIEALRKENLPLFGKLDPKEFRDFNNAGDGLIKAFGEGKATHTNLRPEIIGHICAGNIPGIAAFEMVMDKFLDAATWLKVPTEEPVLGALYAQSIEDVDPDLAHTIAVLPFKSGSRDIEEFLFSNSDIVRAIGGEEARINLTELAKKCKVPIAGHWHKLSFIAIAREYLDKKAEDIAELVSLDVSAWDQQGCFSPQEVFVEEGGNVTPLKFAELVAEEMNKTYQVLPKGSNTGKINILDGYHRFFKKKALDASVEIFSSKEHHWLVIYDGSTPHFEPSGLFRIIKIKPVADIMSLIDIIRPIKRYLQTIGVAIPMERLIPLADMMGEQGATNIRVVGTMTLLKAWEPWDGKLILRELLEQDDIRWVSINTRDIAQGINESLERKKSIGKES